MLFFVLGGKLVSGPNSINRRVANQGFHTGPMLELNLVKQAKIMNGEGGVWLATQVTNGLSGTINKTRLVDHLVSQTEPFFVAEFISALPANGSPISGVRETFTKALTQRAEAAFLAQVCNSPVLNGLKEPLKNFVKASSPPNFNMDEF